MGALPVMDRRIDHRIVALDACAIAARRHGSRRAFAGIARRQHGAVSRAQLVAAGWTESAVDGRVRRGELTVVHRGVYLAGPVGGPRLEETAAILTSPSPIWVSHGSALHLLGVLGSDPKPDPVHVCTRDVRLRRPGIAAHRAIDLADDEVRICGGLPCTTAARSILDIAADGNRERVEYLLGQVFVARQASRGAMLVVIGRHPGRAGVGLIHDLLESDRGPAVTRSAPERRLLALVRAAQLPAPMVNSLVVGWEVDFLWPDARLIVEVDAQSTHSDPRAFERDRRKDAQLLLAGYSVIRVTRRQLEREPHAVIARIAAALALRPAA